MSKVTFDQGWSAAPFGEQFPELSPKVAKMLDDYNHAITTLYMGELLTQSQVDAIRQKKMPKVVARALREAKIVEA